MQGALRKKQYHCFFHEAPNISRINHFDTYILGKRWETEIKSRESAHFTFQKYYISGAPQTKQYHCFFSESPNIFRKIDFCRCPLDLLQSIQRKKTAIKILYILDLLHTSCSTKEAMKLLPWQNIWNLKKKMILRNKLSVKRGKFK